MKKVAIIGGGLAGTACAYVLKHSGAEPVIYEAGDALAPGASGNSIGLYNPRFSAYRTPQSDYYVSGFALAVHTFRILEDIDWRQCGSLHLVTDEKKERRFPQTFKNWGWDFDHMRLISAKEASNIAGVEVNNDALYLPDSGYVSPEKICRAYVEGVEVNLNSKIEDLNDIDADAIIVANAHGATEFPQVKDLPLGTVRGQLTQVRESSATKDLKCNLCYGGYFSPAFNGVHTLGATFQRWLDHDDIIDEDDEDNIGKLADVFPLLAEGLEIVGQRASVRCATKDHFPITGNLPGSENIFVSLGHGSHGIISTLVSATLLTDMILERPRGLPRDVQQALSASRFL